MGKLSILERLQSKIAIDDAGCWNWTGSKFWDGYGQFGIGGKIKRAHRVSYEIHTGPITDGLHVCHRCDNRACVNPSHLFLATNAENTADKMAKGRYGKGQGGRGTGHHRAKLTDADIYAIWKVPNTPGSTMRLAKQYGISHTQMYKIRNKQSWTHLTQQKTP